MVRTRVPKLIGEDMELGNFVRSEHSVSTSGSGDRAARLLLREVPGTPSSGSSWSWQTREWEAGDWPTPGTSGGSDGCLSLK